MKKSVILILIMVGALICSWHHQADARYRELTVSEKKVLRIAEALSEAGAVLSKYIGPATATVEVLNPVSERHRKGELLGNGSCVFIYSDNYNAYVLTNWHVVKKYWASVNDGNVRNDLKLRIAHSFEEDGEISHYEAEYIDSLPAGPDYALLKVFGRNFPESGFSYLKLGDSDKIRSGHRLFAIGSPFNLKYTFIDLMVSTIAPTVDNYSKKNKSLIQVAGAINPGMSGGPVVNLRGELIGLMVANMTNEYKIDEEDKKLLKRINNTNIGFVTPINLAKDFIKKYVPEVK